MKRLAPYLLVCAWMVPTVASAQEARSASPGVRVVRTDTPPTIDGHLTEPMWQRAAVIEPLTQAEPDEGTPASERTRVYLLYDADTLYIGIRAYDADATRIVGRERQRDNSLDGDDYIAIALDPFHSRKHGYYLQVNALGTRRDGLISPETNTGSGTLTYSADWDGIWYAAATIDAEGWTAEIAIPMKTLSFDPTQDTWGFNIERKIARKNELDRWQGATRNKPVFAMGQAGDITGLTGLHQGVGLDIVPYTKFKVSRDNKTGREVAELKPGLDVFYKLTPSITAALTVNTDFAEAEVDDRRVNLTRFPLFFPEKRAFFLQDTNYFNFGGISGSPLPFFTRKIGLSNTGEPIDILGGLKLTGRAGSVSFGLLDVQTDAFDRMSSKNLAVGRAMLDVGKESSAGFIFTRGNPLGHGDNTLGGVDFHYKDSNILGSDQVLEANGYMMRSDGAGQSGNAMGLRLLWPNFHWNGALNFDQIGQGFDPALGFLDRPGVRVYEAWLGPKWRPKGFDHMLVWPYLYMRTDLDNRLIDSALWLPQFELATQSRDHFLLAPILTQEQFFEPFNLLPGITIPPGKYTYWRYLIGVDTAATRVLSASFYVTPGTYLHGTRTDFTAKLTWRPVDWFSLRGTYEQNAIHVPQGAFTVHLSQVNLNFAFTPNLLWNLVTQHDNVSNDLGFNSRLRWTVTPGSDVFLVFNQGADTSRGNFRFLKSDLSAKIAWTFRF